jgi:hypothetical protein
MKNRVIWILSLLMSLQAQAQTLPSGLKKNLKQANVQVVGDTIIARTGKIERKWCWNNKGLLTTSIKDVSLNKDWAKPTTEITCDWNLPEAIGNDTKATFVSLDVHVSTDEGFTSPHLELITHLRYESAHLEVQHVVWLFPNAPGIRTQLRVKAMDGFSSENLPGKEGKRNDCGYDISVPSARCEYLPLNFSVENARRYWGYYNNPGGRHDPSRDMLEETVIKGYPLFLTEDNNWASGLSVEYNNGENGVCVVKESPKCVNQQAHYTGSYYSGPNGLTVTGWGLTPDEIVTDRYRECWATWTIVWSQGNDGMQLALKQFDRARYPVFPERDMFILSNTWGPANPDGAQFTEQEYLMKEIPALANLGIDVMQIDDGWQKGGRFSDAHGFSPKYKNGWKDIKAEADKYKLRFGLWVTAKLSTTEELNKNVDELEFVSWKADFDHLANRGDYEERIKKYRDVMKHSWLKTQFSLCPEYDDPRYGWYFSKEYGSIYFQNIQESLPAHLTMVPYQVLRQHWLMTKYFNSNKLQVMLQNPKRANPERSDAPQHSHSYCFAMGVPFVPCFFQSAQYLDKQGQEELKNFVALYKKHRRNIFESYSFPIGEKPSNDSWSGFQFVNESMDKGYFLLFRELHNQEASKSIQLKFLAKKTIKITNIETGETSQKKVSPTGEVDFRIENPAGYAFLTYVVIR